MGSFYSLQRPTSFCQWDAATHQDFIFSIKGSRYITHMLRLRNVEELCGNFFARGLLRGLVPKPRTDPMAAAAQLQLPGGSGIEPFLALLPTTQKQAAELARNHDGSSQ